MGGRGRFYAMTITKSEGVASVEVNTDSERYVNKQDIISLLYEFFRDVVNNHQDYSKLLKLIYRYRETFLYITTLPKTNFFINRDKLIQSVETVKHMERRLSQKIFALNIDILDNDIPIISQKIDPEKLKSFQHNKDIRDMMYAILHSFDGNLELNFEKGNKK